MKIDLKKEKGKNQGRKMFDTGKKGFQPNKFQPLIKVTSQNNTLEVGSIYIGDEFLDQVKEIMTSKTQIFEKMYSHDPDDRIGTSELVSRMVDLNLSKKLALSLSPSQHIEFDNRLSVLQKMKVSFTTALVPIIDGLGHMDVASGRWMCNSQPFLATNLFYKAVLNNIPACGMQPQIPEIRRNAWIINAHWSNSIPMLLEHMKDIINQWVNEGHDLEINAGDAITVVPLPMIKRGFIGYNALIFQMMKPGYVMRALHVGMILERIMARPNGVPIQQDFDDLNAQTVHIVNLDKSQEAQLAARFHDDVTSRLEGPLAMGFAWSNDIAYSDKGKEWQLSRAQNDWKTLSPIDMPPGEEYYAWMFSSRSSGWFKTQNTKQHFTTGELRSDAIRLWIEQAMKRG